LVFTETRDWTVRAAIGDRPFVLERTLGRGRIVLVADGHFLWNRGLADADAAPLAVDLARAYGAPRFPEGGTGAQVERRTAAYLLRSPALGLFVGLALTGMLFAWQGSLVPPRSLADEPTEAPTLGAFVDSLAILYAGTRDHGRVLERYRALTAGRLRRHFGLPPETPLETLAARLQRDTRLDRATLALLAEGRLVRDEAALRVAVAALDALVREATA